MIAKADLWSVGAVFCSSLVNWEASILMATANIRAEVSTRCVGGAPSRLCGSLQKPFMPKPLVLITMGEIFVLVYDAHAWYVFACLEMEHCLHSANRNANVNSSTSEQDNITVLAKDGEICLLAANLHWISFECPLLSKTRWFINPDAHWGIWYHCKIELVVLAIWKKVLEICNHWVAFFTEGSELPESSSANEIYICSWRHTFESPPASGKMAFVSSLLLPASGQKKVSFSHLIVQRSYHIISETWIEALAVGTSGAVDEYMENKGGADVSQYSKSNASASFLNSRRSISYLPLENLHSFINSCCRKRIQSYILNLQSHRSHFSMLQPIS
ncbi:hypothetical protein D5086_005152 [Populus alba]|uniref:Uncharacterized protein n=1 Tax=Populus alba TaxID=43335 RepID=A0ACC4CTK5_POPAL